MTNDTKTTDAPLVLRRDINCALDLDPGEFCYRRDGDRVKWLHFWPRDSSCALSAAITPQRNSNGATWTLSGPEEAPTLTPSVNAQGCWHGFLTAGVARQ